MATEVECGAANSIRLMRRTTRADVTLIAQHPLKLRHFLVPAIFAIDGELWMRRGVCPYKYDVRTNRSSKRPRGHGFCDLHFRRLAPGFHRRVKAKTSLKEDDVPIDDTTTKPLFTPQETGRKGTRDKVPRLRWNPWQKHEHGKPPKKFKDDELQALLDEDDAQTQEQFTTSLTSLDRLFAFTLFSWYGKNPERRKMVASRID
ncbi:hypothetical protein LAZ67_X003582 [Cordylochernes scorpioides]|uniref:Uncharacterized protein n=1 Tax=Cordylochernes scorpioides TaxID=51811 RepID=A0ABY6LYC6_9ARAC|nr:hypothetical protein LAZ67_X003582 [Cordylochernes scorpioides]